MTRSIALIVSCLLAAACSEHPRHGLLIVLDAARPDHFSVSGYPKETTPNMDALAARGVWFENHYTQGTYTRLALPALLYSRYYARPVLPPTSRVVYQAPEELFRVPDEQSVSIPKVLSGAGLHTVMISAHTWLGRRSEFAREFDEAHDLSTELKYHGTPYPPADRTVDYAIDWIEKNRNREFFVYLHLMDTHYPHTYEDDTLDFLDPEIDAYAASQALTPSGLPKNPEVALTDDQRAYVDALYDRDLHYTDRHLGRLFDSLGSDLDEYVIAITSDHGEHLGEVPGRVTHGGPWYEKVARVPLILFAPASLGAERVEALTESIDVLPTLARLLGARIPEGAQVDGVDLTPVVDGADGDQYAFMRRSVRGPRYKVLFKTTDDVLLAEAAPEVSDLKGRLFDLQEDPGETTDLWAEKPEVVAEHLERYRSRLQKPWVGFAASTADVQPELPFAIPPSAFARDAPELDLVERTSLRKFAASEKSWALLLAQSHSYLMCNPGAPPFEVEVPIPSGRYLLSAQTRGVVEVRAGEASAKHTSRWPEGDEKLPWALDWFDVGEVEVQGGRFSAIFEPDTSDVELCLVGQLGFQPLHNGQPDDLADQSELNSRLRALGYVD